MRDLEVATIDRRRFLGASAGVIGSTTMLGTLWGCGDSAKKSTNVGEPPARPTGTVALAMPSEPETFNPSQAMFGYYVTVNAYEGLMRYGGPKGDELVGALAKSWEVSPDAMEAVFTLRDGVTFHDGTPFDAEAVKTAWEYLIDDVANGGFPGTLLPKFRKIDASDPLKLRLVLAEPAPDLLRNQTFMPIISPKLIAKGNDVIAKEISGTGPYMLSEYRRGQNTIMKAHPDYWGPGPYFERMEFPLIRDARARITALTTGKVDVVSNIMPSQLKELEANKNVRLHSRESWQAAYLIFNVKSPLTKDVRVRRAILHAVDRETLVENVMRGEGTVVDSIVPKGVYGYDEPDKTYPFDPDRAKALLAEAGVASGQKLRMATGAAGNVMGPEMTQAIAEQLRDVGFDVQLDTLEATVLTADLHGTNKQHDLYYTQSNEMTGGPFILSLGLYQVTSGFTTKEFESLLKRMDATPDGVERQAIITRIIDIFADQVPARPMQVNKLVDATRADIGGYVPPKPNATPFLGGIWRAKA